MKKQFNFLKIALIGAVGILSCNLHGQAPGQCPPSVPAGPFSPNNIIYEFNVNGKRYELVKQGANWVTASQCAVQRGGYLAEISSLAEQNGILQNVNTFNPQAGIIPTNTTAQDGGGAAYVWLGGTRTTNGGLTWRWDGNMDTNGATFWQGGSGGVGGAALNNAYTNWGVNEPDNFQGNQNSLAMALQPFPNAYAGQWNDLNIVNSLFYIIEYNNSTLATNENQQVPKPAELYPSIVTDFLFIKKTQKIITEINITNAAGNKVKSISGICRISDRIDCLGFPNGVYFVELKYTDTTTSNHKFIKISK